MLILVHRSGVCGSDLSALSHPPTGSLVPGQTILGHEFAGEIVALGPEVQGFSLGDRVTSMAFAGCGACSKCRSGEVVWCERRRSLRGAYAEYARSTVGSCWTLPPSVSFSVGALTEPVAVAVHAVSLAGPLQGARVLVIGAGPIGILTAWIARREGAGEVVISARTRRAEQVATKISGATFFPADELENSLAPLLGGPPDVVFDCAGGASTLSMGAGLLRARGRAVVVSGRADSVSVMLMPMLRKEITVQFSVVYLARDFERAVELVETHHDSLATLIGRTVTWDEFPIAITSAVEGRSENKLQLAPQL